MSHVPPGVIATEKALWMYPQFNHRFNEIILEYSDIIAGLYFGHEHMDNFRISYKSGMYGYKQMWGIRQRYSNSQTTLSTMYMTRPFFSLTNLVRITTSRYGVFVKETTTHKTTLTKTNGPTIRFFFLRFFFWRRVCGALELFSFFRDIMINLLRH